MDEIDVVLEGRRPEYSDLANLAYLRMVVDESMRLYPPAWAIGRRTLEPVPVGGIELRPGDEPTLARWRKRLFIATSHITADAADEFGLPRDRTLIVGSHIDV